MHTFMPVVITPLVAASGGVTASGCEGLAVTKTAPAAIYVQGDSVQLNGPYHPPC